MKKTVKWLAMLLLAACASYSPPAPDAQQAELILKSNLQDDTATTKNWSRVHNFFHAFADAGCTQHPGSLAAFRGFGDMRGPQETVKVAAGKRIYIRADSQTGTHAQVGQRQTNRVCYNFVSFMPEAGQVYEMRQTDPGPFSTQGCTVQLRNVNEPPPAKSFIEHKFEGQCARLVGK